MAVGCVRATMGSLSGLENKINRVSIHSYFQLITTITRCMYYKIVPTSHANMKMRLE